MTTLITHPNFSSLGEELQKDVPELNIGAGTTIREFRDTWPEIFFANPDRDIRGQDVVYLGDYSLPHHLFVNSSVVRGLIDYNARKVDIIVPYFPVGTNERVTKPGDVPTAKYLADMLGHIPPTSGRNSIHIFDIHALAEKFYFDNFTVNTELHTAMSLIKEKLDKDAVVVFPDEGAIKRFGSDFAGIESVFCSKKRSGDQRTITVESGSNLSGKDAIIIDDLIMSGGTIVETAKKLREMGARGVSAFATHGVFTGDAPQKLSAALDTLYTTDTIPKNRELASTFSNMQVLSIKELIRQQILQLL